MQCPILLPGALSELFAQATSSGYITKADRYGLMAALLAEQLDSEQRSAIDRMLHAVRRGRLKIADELSVVATSGTNSLSVTILAGGLSSRMGRDKALLNIDGVPLLQKICQVGLVCTDKVYVLTPWPEKYQEILPNGCQAIEEVTVPGATQPHGPLLGFCQGLIHVDTEWVLVLACDLPRLEAKVVQGWVKQLAKVDKDAIALLPRNYQKGWEPLCGFYRRACLPLAIRFINQGGKSFQQWLAQYPVEELVVKDSQVLFNCNTPEEFKSLGKSGVGNLLYSNRQGG